MIIILIADYNTLDNDYRKIFSLGDKMKMILDTCTHHKKQFAITIRRGYGQHGEKNLPFRSMNFTSMEIVA